MNWYVYHIKDPRNNQIFYVGKGTGYRCKATINTKIKDCNFLKKMIIEDIRSEKLEPIVEIVSYFETELESLEFEKKLITHYGRIIKGTGCLVNLSDGGDTSNTGWNPSDSTRKLWSSQRKGKNQSKEHIESRSKKLRGKKRNDSQKRNYVLASIRRTNPEIKVKILMEIENLPFKYGLYTEMSKKFNVPVELISRIHNNIELYKESLSEWIKK